MTSTFVDDFDSDSGLDPEVWLPHYLPHWSSREESAATWNLADSVLTLSIPPSQGLWCADTHPAPLRVSAVQSGSFSGPVGSSRGQQPFADGQSVRHEEPLWRGWTPHGGTVEVRARLDLSARSMASVWMVGLEDQPARSGEICVFEVFGDTVDAGSAAIGSGVHAFRDPALSEDFEAPRRRVDVGDWHTYAVDWQADRIDFFLDGELLRTVSQSPAYEMQVIAGVFDFPERSVPGLERYVPRLLLDSVRGRPHETAG